MTIAIDASRAIIETAGIGRYTKNMVQNLLEIDKTNKFILIFTYFRTDKGKEEQINKFRQSNVTIRTAKIPGSLKETLWRGKSKLYNRLYQGADVLLAPSFLEYKHGLKIPQVTVIHDMATFLFPEQRGLEISQRLSNQTLLAINNSQKIIAISESTKSDVIKFAKTPEGKIKVVYPGLNKLVQPSESLPNNLKTGQYILFVGTLEPRKNLKNLIAAYDQLPNYLKDQYPLVIVGAKGWNMDDVLKESNENIIFLGFQPDNILSKLYESAKVFVYPSLYEGFGLPVLEAMQFGTPIVTSNRSSLPEVAGKAAVLIDPDDIKSITNGLQSVLEGKIDLVTLKKEAANQVNKFDWVKTAEQTLKLLEEAKNV